MLPVHQDSQFLTQLLTSEHRGHQALPEVDLAMNWAASTPRTTGPTSERDQRGR